MEGRWNKGLFLCVGLDSEFERMPESARTGSVYETLVGFNKAMVDATHDLVCAFKPNSAFYEAYGEEGWRALKETISYIQKKAPDVPIILDAKRGDIDNTNKMYAASAFDYLGVDAITVSPYLGGEPLAPFLERKEKGIIILCHTSNPGAGEIQNLLTDGEPLYKIIARLTATSWNTNGNCCAMVGATYVEELREVRRIVGDMPILIPGVGAQNGELKETITSGVDSRRKGLIVNASRSVIFASSGSDFAEAARAKALELHSAIRNAQ